MPNPRKKIDFTGIDANQVTYRIDGSDIVYDANQPGGSSVVGRAVTLSAAETVRLAGDGDPIAGKLVLVESDGFCSVQHRGFCELPGGDAAALNFGRKFVGALGAASARGFIRAAAAAAGAFAQATVQDALNGRGRIVNAAVTTAVVVEL